ncbi:fructose-1,6-bisphosphatase class 3 [Tetragenococcus halophilus subsp. flandriensis]|uniref:fructose-1,6-bisphosphatase n=1 Tax=Tetragenococcus halophilus TaxID=51669 RepID=UPI0023E94C23|nr:fructose-1,6-bisphosphatase [Tetragenococcus halophilus]GMA06870.1 fructose-1,6-bisphosphatase class 3 [Tetragenococcus halophilus subsp. flandriensis]
MSEVNYYSLLKENFENKENVITELINLEAILHLPKGTEHFISDVHGEYDAFDHVLRNGSGSVKEKLAECLDKKAVDIDELATLIYYPEEKIKLEKERKSQEEVKKWYAQQIQLLIIVVNYTSRKYTRSKVHKALPSRFSYVIEELLTEKQQESDKQAYIQAIIDNIIQLRQAAPLISALCYVIQRFVVDHLHVVGDIYDRGPAPDMIMERLIHYHSVDIQWGNHDIIWLASMAGSPLALINVLRICARYGNLAIIEDRYGVNLRPLVEYSHKYYPVLDKFLPKLENETDFSAVEKDSLNKIQQATAILQFKLEGQLIKRRPEFLMDERSMLDFINYSDATINLQGKTYPLVDFNGPTIDPNHPCELTKEEEELVKNLLLSFQNSEPLRRHMDFLMEKGNMYLCYNGNLLLHGCIPLHQNGDFKSLRIGQTHYSGKSLLVFFEAQIRYSYAHPELSNDFSTDLLWYLWTGECSSLFGKKVMATFERYYIEDKQTHHEEKNAYYRLRNQEAVCQEILKDFDLPITGHIINGHTPVKANQGENPIKANGRMLVIDGGFAKSYQKETGLAGYTLLSNSYGLQLVAHQPFSSVKESVEQQKDILSTKRLVERVENRTRVSQTNIGKKLMQEKKALETLYENYDFY